MNGITKAILYADTQKELAKVLGVSQQAISGWKRLGYVSSFHRCQQIHDIFGIPMKDLLNPELITSVKEMING